MTARANQATIPEPRPKQPATPAAAVDELLTAAGQRRLELTTPSAPLAVDPDAPALRPHRADGETACRGMLREVDRDQVVVVGRCDVCGFETSFRPEVVDRDVRVAAILRRAQLPARFVDEPLPPHPGTRDARTAIGELIERWGEDGVLPPFLHGLYGRGKTHLLTRTGRLLVERHEVRLRYLTMPDLLDEAKRAMDDRGRGADTVQDVFDRAARVALLVLDDLAELRTDWQRDVLEQLVDRRYRGIVVDGARVALPIMGATNVPVGRWPDAFGHRVASRLLELTNPVAVDGPDWRRA